MNQETPEAETKGRAAIGEEFISGLPVWAQDFVREHGREVLAAIVIVLGSVALWSGYSAYTGHNENQASAQLGRALREADDETQIPTLDAFARKHAHTAAGRQALLLLAAAHREAGELDEAAEVYRNVIQKLDSDSAFGDCARLGLAYVEEERKQVEAAREQYRKVSQMRRGLEAVAILGLARAEVALGNEEAALQAYNSYLSLRPESPDLDFVRNQIPRLSRSDQPEPTEESS